MQFGGIKRIKTDHTRVMGGLADALEALAPHAGSRRHQEEVLALSRDIRQALFTLSPEQERLRAELEQGMKEMTAQGAEAVREVVRRVLGQIEGGSPGAEEEGLRRELRLARDAWETTEAQILDQMVRSYPDLWLSFLRLGMSTSAHGEQPTDSMCGRASMTCPLSSLFRSSLSPRRRSSSRGAPVTWMKATLSAHCASMS